MLFVVLLPEDYTGGIQNNCNEDENDSQDCKSGDKGLLILCTEKVFLKLIDIVRQRTHGISALTHDTNFDEYGKLTVHASIVLGREVQNHGY